MIPIYIYTIYDQNIYFYVQTTTENMTYENVMKESLRFVLAQMYQTCAPV